MTSGSPHNNIKLDGRGRPFVRLDAGDAAPPHDVVLEQVRPFVQGLCVTCFDDWHPSSVANRKARSCAVMVWYLAEVNRDRSLTTELRGAVANLGIGAGNTLD